MQDTAPDGLEAFGFNTEVSYRHLTYHVQTESMVDDSHRTINTLVYLRGALVKKISSSCSDLEPPEAHGEELRERVKKQHVAVLNRIKSGELPSG